MAKLPLQPILMTEKQDNQPENPDSLPGADNDGTTPDPGDLRAPVKSRAKERAKSKGEARLVDKEEMGEFAKTAIFAVLLALVIRTFFFEPFNIPSGSMKPTLLVGDYLFVSKLPYGYSRYSFPFGLAPIEGRIKGRLPDRGDVIVFKQPTNTSVDYIKRVVGLPGERIQVVNGRLYIDRVQVERETAGLRVVENSYGDNITLMEYIETLPGGIRHPIFEESDSGNLDNTPEYVVPADHVFVMGDNRDHSQDSRVLTQVGYVPLENIVGRADVLFFSTNGSASLGQPWKWPGAIRYERLLQKIGPERPLTAQAASRE